MITNIKLRNSLLLFFIKVKICALLYISRLDFDYAMICTVEFVNYIDLSVDHYIN